MKARLRRLAAGLASGPMTPRDRQPLSKGIADMFRRGLDGNLRPIRSPRNGL